MKPTWRRRLFTSLGIIWICTSASAAFAQLEEIVVTARKTQESILDVPMAISAYTSATITENNIKDFDQLAQITPSLSFNELNNGGLDVTSRIQNGGYVIRGLNLPATNGAQAAILFIDGAPYTVGRLGTFDDAERIEVLKGPQAAYFGRNTFSGAINMVTKDPGDTWTARATGDVATYDSHTEEVSLEGPIIDDKLSIRISGIDIHKGGMYKDVLQGEPLGERNTDEGEITIIAKPIDKLRIKLFVDYQVLNDGEASGYNMGALQDGYNTSLANCNISGSPGPNNWFCGTLPWTQIAEQRRGVAGVATPYFLNNVANVYSLDQPNILDHLGSAAQTTHAHAIIDYDFGPIKWNTIAAFDYSRQEVMGDLGMADQFYPCTAPGGCGAPFGQFVFYVTQRPNVDESAETRLTYDEHGKFRATAGYNFVLEHQGPSISGGVFPNTGPIPFPMTGETVAHTNALFGGLYYDLLSNLTVGFEGRYQWDHITAIPINGNLTGCPGCNLQNVLVPSQEVFGTFANFAPRASIEYAVEKDLHLFADYSQGFRPGTFNTILSPTQTPPAGIASLLAAGAQEDVKPETITETEFGVKGKFLDDTLQGSLDGYFGTLSHEQITANATPVLVGQTILLLPFLANAGETDIHGIEAEGSWQPIKKLIMNGSLAWNYTKIVTDYCSICATLTGNPQADIGNRLDNSPEFTAFLGATYTDHLVGDYDWYVRGEYSYRGSIYATRLNLESSGAANILNARYGVMTKSLKIELYGTNLTQNQTPTAFATGNSYNLPPSAGGPSPTAGEFTPSVAWGVPDKRQFGVRATYQF